jgi:hypothetical protein
MPKNSSASKKDWVSAGDALNNRVPKRAWAILAALVVFGMVAFFIWRPKPVAIETVIPSGAIAFLRLDHVQEHLAGLRASGFWQGFSKVDVPKLLSHSEIDAKTINGYNAWRTQMVGIIDHPLFKQFFGREVAVAVYPAALKTADPLDWRGYFSGVLMATRIDRHAQAAEALASIWSQTSREGAIRQSRYKNSTITAVYFQKNNLTVYYTRVKDLLLFSLNENLVASTIDTIKHKALSLNHNEDFLAAAKEFYSDPDGVFYIQAPKARQLVGEYLDKLIAREDSIADEDEDAADNDVPSYEDIEDALDRLDGVRLAGASLSVGRPIRAKLGVLIDPSKMKPGTAAMYRCAPTDNATLEFVPKEAILYQWDNCFDFAGAYQALKASAAEEPGNEDTDEPVKQAAPFAELEKTWGFSIEKDLLPVLGHELGWFVEEVDVKGMFPVPKFVVFLKINDEKKAGDILKRIVTTPVTLVQKEDYNGVAIHFVSIPLFVSFKPSYAFINGYVLISSSDELIKASIDARTDAAKALREQSNYKDVSAKSSKAGNAVVYADVAQVSRQARLLLDWTNKWFLLKINQADAEEKTTRQKLATLKTAIQNKGEELKKAKDKLAALEQEQKQLQAAVDANAVTAEAKDTLSKAGAVAPENKKPSPSLEDLNFKRSQVSAIQLEIDGIGREIGDLENQQPDLEDDLDDLEQQKTGAQNFRYYVDEVAVPLLDGLQALAGGYIHTTFKDDLIESEMFLKTE